MLEFLRSRAVRRAADRVRASCEGSAVSTEILPGPEGYSVAVTSGRISDDCVTSWAAITWENDPPNGTYVFCIYPFASVKAAFLAIRVKRLVVDLDEEVQQICEDAIKVIYASVALSKRTDAEPRDEMDARNELFTATEITRLTPCASVLMAGIASLLVDDPKLARAVREGPLPPVRRLLRDREPIEIWDTDMTSHEHASRDMFAILEMVLYLLRAYERGYKDALGFVHSALYTFRLTLRPVNDVCSSMNEGVRPRFWRHVLEEGEQLFIHLRVSKCECEARLMGLTWDSYVDREPCHESSP